MDNFKSEREAREAFVALQKKNTRPDVRYAIDTLDSLSVDFFSEQKLSFEAMKSVVTQAKAPDEVSTATARAAELRPVLSALWNNLDMPKSPIF